MVAMVISDSAYRLWFSIVGGLFFSMWFLIWALGTAFRAMRSRPL